MNTLRTRENSVPRIDDHIRIGLTHGTQHLIQLRVRSRGRIGTVKPKRIRLISGGQLQHGIHDGADSHRISPHPMGRVVWSPTTTHLSHKAMEIGREGLPTTWLTPWLIVWRTYRAQRSESIGRPVGIIIPKTRANVRPDLEA